MVHETPRFMDAARRFMDQTRRFTDQMTWRVDQFPRRVDEYSRPLDAAPPGVDAGAPPLDEAARRMDEFRAEGRAYGVSAACLWERWPTEPCRRHCRTAWPPVFATGDLSFRRREVPGAVFVPVDWLDRIVEVDDAPPLRERQAVKIRPEYLVVAVVNCET